MTSINKSLLLLRGLPGSGKTTLGRILSEKNKYPVFSVDDFFTDPSTGNYQFEFDKNHLAYKACEENVTKAMERNEQKIFVANTFTMKWEMEPYFKLASRYNYAIYVVTVENYHEQKNIHSVTDEQILKMAEKYHVKLF